MKNPTVKELIEILKGMNPDAIVCHFEFGNPDDKEPQYSSFEICREIKDVDYIDDSGDTKRGDIVAIF